MQACELGWPASGVGTSPPSAPRAELEGAFLGSGPVPSCCNLLQPRRERFPSGRRLDTIHPKGHIDRKTGVLHNTSRMED